MKTKGHRCFASHVHKYRSQRVVFTEEWELEMFKTAEVTFKVTQGHRHIGIGAIRYDTCDFLLVFHCNYIYLVPFTRY